MALPKINHLLYTDTLPCSKEEIKYRSFTGKEEKMMMTGKASENTTEFINSVIQTVNNCIVTEDFDIEKKLPIDLVYLFLKIRERSVSNIIEFKFKDEETNRQVDAEIDISEMEVEYPEKEISDVVEINDNISVKLERPNLGKVKHIDEKEGNIDTVKYTIQSVITEDDVYVLSDFSEKEVKEFVESIPTKKIKEIVEYANNIPSVYLTAKWIDMEGKEQSKRIEGMQAFLK